eukprot:1161009-Pelagomonas_calceolata.AAC.3
MEDICSGMHSLGAEESSAVTICTLEESFCRASRRRRQPRCQQHKRKARYSDLSANLRNKAHAGRSWSRQMCG